MKKKLLLVSFVLVLLMGCFTGCGSSDTNGESAAEGTKVVKDMTGVEITVPEEVKSVVNCWPSSTQMMMTLGAADKLVGVMGAVQSPSFTWMWTVEPKIKEAPAVTDESGSVNVEEMLKLEPDLVITSGEEDAESYRNAGLNAACMMFNNYDGLRKSVTALGEMLGKEESETAKKYVEYLDGNIAKVEDALKDLKDEDKPTVYYMDGQQGESMFTTAGPGSIMSEWIDIAGGKIATEGVVEGMSQEITPEQILEIDPDMILIGGSNQAKVYKSLMADETMKQLSAVKSGNVHRIPQGTFQWCRFSSESALQILWAAKTIHPDQFKDLNMKKETKAFYKEYFNYDLSNKEVNAILAGKNAPDGE